jgi:hypothetical protein
MKTLRILRTFSILALTSALSIGLIGFVSLLVYSFFGEVGMAILGLCVILLIAAVLIETR